MTCLHCLYSVPPLYDPPSQQFTVIEGFVTTISFQLDALPRVTNFFWTHNGEPITSSAKRRLTANGVTFTSIRREDSGVYTVTSVDRLGIGSARLTIDVYCELSKNYNSLNSFIVTKDYNCFVGLSAGVLLVVVDINTICIVILGSPRECVCDNLAY